MLEAMEGEDTEAMLRQIQKYPPSSRPSTTKEQPCCLVRAASGAAVASRWKRQEPWKLASNQRADEANCRDILTSHIKSARIVGH